MALPSSLQSPSPCPRPLWCSTLIFLPGDERVWPYVNWIWMAMHKQKVGLCSHAHSSVLSLSLNPKGAFTGEFTTIRCFYINNTFPIQVCAFYLYSFKSWNCLDNREGLYIIYTPPHSHTQTHTHTHSHTFLRAAWTFRGNWRGFVSSTAKSSLSISNRC